MATNLQGSSHYASVVGFRPLPPKGFSMSTKIYDAFRVKTNGKMANLNQLMDISADIKKEVVEMAADYISKRIATRVQYYYDLYEYYGEDILKSETIGEDLKTTLNRIKNNESDAVLYCREYSQLIKEIQDEPYEYTYTKILFIPCGRLTLAMYFGQSEYIDTIINNENFEDYHYQNQTDKPDDVSTRAWNKRKRDWDKAIGPDYIPINHGFEYTLVDYTDTHFEVIALKRGRKALNWAKEQTDSRAALVRETIDYPLMKDAKSVCDYMEISKTEEYQVWKKETEEEIKKKLNISGKYNS